MSPFDQGRELLDILKHACASDHDHSPFYRNHFCAPLESDVADQCRILIGLGLMKEGSIINDGSYQYFHVTSAGILFLKNAQQ